MFLAETVFQSMDGSLEFIGIVLVALAIVVLITALSLESKLARLIRIQRAIYDLMVADKTSPETKVPPVLPPPVPTPRQSEAATAPEVYRID